VSLQGWIIYNGQIPGSKFLDFAEWIKCSADRKDSHTQIYKNNELHSLISSKKVTFLKNNQDDLPDYVVFTDKDIYLAKQLELQGVHVFNSSEAIAVSDDKILSYQQLARYNIPIPKTIIAPKTFPGISSFASQTIQVAIDTFEFPMIVKEAFGSFGEQVYLIHNEPELINKVNELRGKPFIFQEFIASSYGQDMRLHVVGDEVVAAMRRYSTNDFRANITTGGMMESYHPTKLEKELAIAATKAIGADFAGVDLLLGPTGKPIVCEVNSNAHIRNMFDCTNINVADFMIDYILDRLKEK